MALTQDQLNLIVSARARQPGALRKLAVIFDEQLSAQDACLDGAVAASRVVRRRRARFGRRWAQA